MFNVTSILKYKYYHFKKDWEKAAKELEKSLNKRVNVSKWHYQLGFYYSKLKRWNEAEIHLAIATNNPNAPKRWHYRHSIALDNTNKKDKAKKVIQLIHHQNGDNAKKHFESGILLLGFSRYAAAEDSFKKAIEIDDTQLLYFDKLSEALNKQFKWWQEVEALNSAVVIDEQNISLLKRLGNALEKMENYSSAIEIYNKAITIKPNDAALNYSLGFCLQREGNQLDADNFYSLAIKYDTNLNAKKLGIGIFHKRKGLWLDAAIEFEKQSVKDPNNAELLYVTGMAFDRSYHWNKAEAFYKKAISIKQGQASWNFRLGLVLERQKKWGQAAAKYEIACRASAKHNTHYFYRLGFCYHKMKQYEKSCLAFLMMRTKRGHQQSNINYKVFSTSPWTAEEHYQRAYELELAGNENLSTRFLENATMRNNVYSSDYYYSLGYNLFKKGDYFNAANAFLETRILTKAYGVELADFDKNDKLKKINSYLEYYNRLTIRDNIVMLESFHGASVSCNPFAIYQHMISRPEFKSFIFVWAIKEGVKTPEIIRRKQNVIVVVRDSDLYKRYLASAKYLINNVTFPEYFIRKDGQIYLNTWHGTPIKYLGKDIKDSFLSHYNVARNFMQATHIISQNDYTNKILVERYDVAHTCNAAINVTGYPRTDITLNLSSKDKVLLRTKFNILPEQKVILYAPTWRGEHGKAKFDIEKLIKDLSVVVKQGHKVLFRGHHMIESLLQKVKLPVQIVPASIDTNKILAITDLLITDYSSIAFDFLPTQKAIIYYAYDIEEYLEERGLYKNLENLPGTVCYSIDELSKAIPKLLNFIPDLRYKESLNEYCPFEDGTSSRRVVDLVFFGQYKNLHNVQNVPDKKNILIYAGPFIPNGIATSINNLLSHIDYSLYNISIAVDISSINNNHDRLHEIGKVPECVNILGYKGTPILDLEESWIKSKFDAFKNFNTKEMQEIYLHGFYRDFMRNFGTKDFDAIINFEGYDKKWVSLFASVPKDKAKRKIVYQHNDMLSECKSRFPYLKCNFSLYDNFDSIVSVSEATRNHNRDNLSSEFNISNDKFVFSDNVQNPNYVIDMAGADFEDEYIFSKETKTFITLGRMSPEKDHIKLINAFNMVHSENKNIQLIILGDGPLRNEIFALVKKLGLNDKIHLLGRKNNPFPYLKRSDCFILSSNHEGQPMVLFEAMVLEMPIIATDIVGNRGVLQGKTGQLVENSVSGLAFGMNMFLNDELPNSNFNHQKYQKNAMNMFYKQITG